MQKKADNKQNWMTADRSNGSVIGNAQIGTVSGTKVIFYASWFNRQKNTKILDFFPRMF